MVKKCSTDILRSDWSRSISRGSCLITVGCSWIQRPACLTHVAQPTTRTPSHAPNRTQPLVPSSLSLSRTLALHSSLAAATSGALCPARSIWIDPLQSAPPPAPSVRRDPYGSIPSNPPTHDSSSSPPLWISGLTQPLLPQSRPPPGRAERHSPLPAETLA